MNMIENIECNTLVSVLVPIYNVEKYIQRCAESLFEQTYVNIEYIFVDDCGTDNSIDILKKITNKYPQRKNNIKIISHEKNRGLAAARNTAIKNAFGEFVMAVDSDDFLEKETIELLVNKQLENNADIILYGFKNIFPTYSYHEKLQTFNSAKDLCLKQLSRKVRWTIAGEFVRRNLYIKHNIHSIEGCNMGEDYNITPRLAYYAHNVDILDFPLYNHWVQNKNSMTRQFSISYIQQLDDCIKILNEFFEDKGNEYIKALNEAEVKIRIRNLLEICKNKGPKALYKEQYEKLIAMNSSLSEPLPLKKRILVHFFKYRVLMNLFCRSYVHLKRS